MVNMKMSDEERSEQYGSVSAEAPVYPYGLRISLDDDALEKLKMPALPQVDQTMIITARVKVVSVSSEQMSGEDMESRVDLQITDMEIGSDRGESDAAKSLYGE